MQKKRSKKKMLLILVGSLIGLYLLLLIPESAPRLPEQPAGTPFEWNRDAEWDRLQATFEETKQLSPEALDTNIAALSQGLEQELITLSDSLRGPKDESYSRLLEDFFAICPFVAVRSQQLPWLIDFYSRSRTEIKRQSQYWNLDAVSTRQAMYQLLYGMRAAVEEVVLQAPEGAYDPAMMGKNEPSQAPATEILGIPVHSGDLLLSRGGAAVSALISRGNDYPGNFSHVALIYIDEVDQTPYLIEAHIEKGVAMASVEEYLKDKKLRFMVLRPRADLPTLQSDPLSLHTSAAAVREEALNRHIPYDFKMDFHDPTTMFCSEVGSYAYHKSGIELWQAQSTISAPGTVAWLASFGVENFVTQSPADLEYDPQMTVVGEWRDAETLFKDHLDNAVIDVMLEKASGGATVDFNHFMLPFARLLKAYCWVLNRFGKVGKIPEGMSATVGLKNEGLTDLHTRIKARTQEKVDTFIETKGYTPPYWELIELATQARDEIWI